MSLSAAMSADSPPSPVFTFESKTHPCSVLRGLEDQWRRGLLCDVTVAAAGMGRSFRAHRSVLTSCSEYFAGVISNHTPHGAVLTLPPEVTAAGFEPLLKFAYTSKLLVSERDVVEIRRAASVLAFRDVDGASFDFLLPKFFGSNGNAAPFRANPCCKRKCKGEPSRAGHGAPNDVAPVGENETKPASDPSSDLDAVRPGSQSAVSQTETNTRTAAASPATDERSTVESFLRCPKYRKFQLACGKGACGVERRPISVALHPPGGGSRVCEEDRFKTQSRDSIADPGNGRESRPEGDGIKDKRDVGGRGLGPSDGGLTPRRRRHHHPEAPAGECSRGGSPGLGRCAAQAKGDGTPGDRGGAVEPRSGRVKVEEEEEERLGSEEGPAESEREERGRTERGGGREEDGEGPTGGGERGGGEAEAAGRPDERPAPGPSPERRCFPSPDAGCAPGAADRLGLPDPGSGATGCPFLRELGPSEAAEGEGAPRPESAGASESPRRPPCISLLSSSEEVDSESDSEADDSCTLDTARQVQLPFSVDWVVDLSKNDFQQLLKKRRLTQEQLDFVQDMRRRSKNRMAARRCRKRKLDRVYNLEIEIARLRTEKERILAERGQLHHLKMRTWYRYTISALCQRICREASLLPEQLQLLANYMAPDWPIATPLPRADTRAQPPQARPSDLDPREEDGRPSLNPGGGTVARGEVTSGEAMSP